MERLIQSWIELTGILKNNRITKNISYNEAIVLNYAYNSFLQNKGVYMQEILKKTKMLKSLCNRTFTLLLKKNFIKKEQDGNQVIIYFNSQKKEEYLKMHQEIIEYLKPIVQCLDEKDIQDFIRISHKISGGVL